MPGNENQNDIFWQYLGPLDSVNGALDNTLSPTVYPEK